MNHRASAKREVQKTTLEASTFGNHRHVHQRGQAEHGLHAFGVHGKPAGEYEIVKQREYQVGDEKYREVKD